MLGEFRVLSNTPLTIEEILEQCVYVAMDYELTGLRKQEDVIIEIGLVFLDKDAKIIATFQVLIDPERDTGAVEVHGIPDEMVAGAPKFIDVSKDFFAMLNGKILAGLYQSLDFSALKRQGRLCGFDFDPGRTIDIYDLLNDSKFFDKYESRILEVMSRQEIEHRALPDAFVVAEIVPMCLEFARDFPTRVKPYTRCEITTFSRAIGRESN